MLEESLEELDELDFSDEEELEPLELELLFSGVLFSELLEPSRLSVR